jgi:hypothetical protein
VLTIPEKSRQGFSFLFEDEDLVPFTPSTVRYRLHDADTNQEVIGWTSVTVLPGETSVVVIIPASANAILDDNNAYETRTLTVQSDFDTDDQLSQDRTYRVQNLSGFT